MFTTRRAGGPRSPVTTDYIITRYPYNTAVVLGV